MKLQDELRARVADLLDEDALTNTASGIRNSRPPSSHCNKRVFRAAERVIALLDDYEDVEVAIGRATGRWYDPNDMPSSAQHTTILVPRAPRPSMLEAVEAYRQVVADVVVEKVGELGTEMDRWEKVRAADRALAEAIKREGGTR